MKNYLFLFISIAALLSSCSNSAVSYNNKLVQIQKEIEPKLNAYVKQMESSDTTNMAALLTEGDKLAKLTEEKLALINKLDVPKGGERLQKAFQNEFIFVLDMVKNIKKMNDKSLKEQESADALTWIMGSEKRGNELDTELRAAQAAFAKDKGFKIESDGK